MPRFVLTLAALSACLLALPAHANHCPQEMKQVDALLESHPGLSPQTLEEVKKLRADGERLHLAGDHAASMEALGKAIRLINAGGQAR